MDLLKSVLPPAKGILPYYMVILSAISIGNCIQAYTTLHFSRRVYNGRFIRNPKLGTASAATAATAAGQPDPEDRIDKLVPASNAKDPKAADQLSPLAGRLFGTWTLITSIVRFYAAYNLHLAPMYNIALWTYVVALGHFGSELFVFKTMSFGPPQLFPFTFASVAIVWMTLVRDYYVEA